MATGKNKILISLVIILALLAFAATYLFSRIDGLVEQLIETEGSRVAGSDVDVTGLHIDLRAGTATIEKLTVASPAPFTSQHAIALTDFLVRIDTASINKNPVIIEEVSVASADFIVEQSSKGNNLKALQHNVQNSPSSGRSSNSGEERKLIIKTFAIESMNAEVTVPEIGESRKVSIPATRLTDIGSADNGASPGELARQILTPVIRKAMQSAAVENVKGKVKQRFDKEKEKLLKGLLERTK